MASGIASLQLRFFADGSWHDEWDAATGGLPQLLEVTLNEADPAGAVPFMTSFTVAPSGGGS